MDDYLFEDYLEASKYLPESNTYLEILNYSDPQFNRIEQHRLEDSEFSNFLHRRGTFAPPELPDGVKLISGLRLVLQLNAKQNLTFDPTTVTLPKDVYRDMVQAFRLSYRWIESSAAVGPLFWACFDQDDISPHLQVIYRKSDVVKKGKTRGWELSFSHDINAGITQGFLKGTSSSDVVTVVKHLRRCNAQIGHAMLMPMIIFGHDMGLSLEQKQRSLRHESRRLENAISLRGDIQAQEGFVINGIVDYDIINQHIIECSTQVLWKNPDAYMSILEGFKGTFMEFWSKVPDTKADRALEKLHESLLSRIGFYKTRLVGIAEYAQTTKERLEVQRHALEMNTSRRENKLNLEIAFQQRQLIHTTKRETEGQKTIATLGIIFLPPTVISGIFSTTFFNFQMDETDVVSDLFWVFWAITVPITLGIFILFILYNKWRESQHNHEDREIAKSVDELERKIQKEMRVRTIARLDTFNRKEDAEGHGVGGVGLGGNIAKAVAASGSAGASLIGVDSGSKGMRPRTRSKTQSSTHIIVEPPSKPIMGELTLQAQPLELRPSGRLSIHSQRSREASRTRDASVARSANGRLREPMQMQREAGVAEGELWNGMAEKEFVQTTPRTDTTLSGGKTYQSGGPEITQGYGIGNSSIPAMVNARRFGIDWVSNHLRRMGRKPDEEQGRGRKGSEDLDN